MPKVFAGNYADIFDIKGKKAVVVGGAGGFGKEIAKAFAQRGVDVLISSRPGGCSEGRLRGHQGRRRCPA